MRKPKSFIVVASFLTGLFLFGGISDGFGKDSPAPVAQQQTLKVSVNKASLEELQSVRGIGPVLAKRIVDFRSSNGSFKALEDLAQVSGIGSAKYEKMKEQLTL